MRTDEELIEALREKYDSDELEPRAGKPAEPVQAFEPAEAVVCCPFCGQVFELTDRRDARLLCGCDGARKWQAAEDRKERLNLAIDKLFGGGLPDGKPGV